MIDGSKEKGAHGPLWEDIRDKIVPEPTVPENNIPQCRGREGRPWSFVSAGAV